jgi:OmpA family
MIPTGPGRITSDSRAHSSGFSDWIYLENFDIDGVTLKSEHRNELRRRFGDMIRHRDISLPADDKWIFLRGYASRTGSEEHNIDLSLQRVENVQSFLISLGLSDSHITGVDYVGEAWSHAEIEEDDQFRCVEVIGRHENIPPPPSTPVFIYDRFRMRARIGSAGEAVAAGLSLLELPGGLGATVLEIQINNLSTRATQNYFFISAQVTAGISASIPSGPAAPRSAPGPGDSPYAGWVEFRTRSNHHVALREFEGSAAFGGLLGAQIGPLSFGDSYFTFESTNLNSVEHYTCVTPRTIILPMPDSIGLGFSLASLSAFGRLYMRH